MKYFPGRRYRSSRRTYSFWILLAIGGWLAGATRVSADASVSAAELSVPMRIPLEFGPVAGAGLEDQGECCVWRDLSSKPPRIAEAVPEKIGDRREFAVLPIADSKVIVSFENLGKHVAGYPVDSLLVRVDADGNRDLTDDGVMVCYPRAPCGPFDLQVRHGRDTIPYSIRFRWLPFSSGAVFWYTRSKALHGTLGGRRIVVIDDNTNGSYDDPEDIVVLDFDGNGVLDGDRRGAERFLRHRIIPWGERRLAIVDVDPVAATMTLDEARWATFRAEVIDLQAGKRIPGARVEIHPGPFVGTTDAKGEVEIQLPAGQLDYVQVVSDGYWGRVVGQGQEAAFVDHGKKAKYRFLLERGPCRHAEVLWCGRESLSASSMDRSQLDLESGVVSPRVGPLPGEVDLGWYVPPGGLVLSSKVGGEFTVLEGREFEDVTAEDLSALDYELKEIKASRLCGGDGAPRGEPELHRGSVLGIRTKEGRLGKIQILGCDRTLDLGWIVYDAPGSRPPTS